MAATSNPPADSALPNYSKPANGDSQQQHPPRRSSFNFLRGGSGKMSKKQKALAQEELLRQQREASAVPQQPPHLPSQPAMPTIPTFGGDSAPVSNPNAKSQARPDSYAIVADKASGYGTNYNSKTMDALQQKVPIPPVPESGTYVDPYARTESMTNRGRYSYASSAVSTLNSPRRVRRRRDPTPFNVLVIGAKNAGKTSFLRFLKESLEKPNKRRGNQSSPPRTATAYDSTFTSEYLETEIDHERIGVTLWDSPGLEKHVVDIQLREISAFLESKFEDTFAEEQRVIRAPGALDTHIHCAFLILDPLRLDANVKVAKALAKTVAGKIAISNNQLSGLDEQLDLQVLRTLQGKTTVIPVISKADTVTYAHMNFLKRTVWDSLKAAKLDPLEALDLDESEDEVFDEREEDEAALSSDEKEDKTSGDSQSDSDGDDKEENRASTPEVEGKVPSTKSPGKSSASGSVKRSGTHRRQPSAMSAAIQEADPELPYLPMSTISPDEYEPEVPGRRFPWGLADPYNVEHCDFLRLKESVFSEWRSELREAAREQWYEGWRTSRLNRRGGGPSKATASYAGTPTPRSLLAGGANGKAANRAVSANPAVSYPPPGPYR